MKKLTLISLLLAFIVFRTSAQQYPSLTFYFNKGDFNLTNTQTDYIDRTLDSLKVSGGCEFKIVGYADNQGGRKRNLILSKQRAESISAYLISKGYDSIHIEAMGIGQIEDSTVILSERAKSLSRKAVLTISCNSVLVDAPGVKSPKNTFENDTVIYGKNGTQVRIKSEAFYPKKIKDVKINILEIFSLCDSIPEDVETVTETGVCLASGGMVFVKAEYKKKAIKPNRNAMFEVRIPVINNDTNYNFYIAVRQKNGTIRWRERKGSIISEDGRKYYVFETNVLGGFNCDVPIPGCDMNIDQYYTLKTWTKFCSVRYYVDNQFSVFNARELSYKKYAIPSNVSPDQIYVTCLGYKGFYFPQFFEYLLPWTWYGESYIFVTKKPYKLSELKYKKSRKLYKLRRRNFQYGGLEQLQENYRNNMRCPKK